jgi:hypothetical protein
LLQRDLIAVLASLRLRIQELWRRNGEGDLSVPGFWPQALAPLFWPLLLALALAIAVAGFAAALHGLRCRAVSWFRRSARCGTGRQRPFADGWR